MGTLAEGITNGYKAALCRLLGSPLGGLARAYDAFGGPTVADNVRAARRWVCGDDPDAELPPIPPPFAGGQCPVLYDIRTRADFVFGSGTVTLDSGVTRVLGPIGGVSVAPSTDGGCGQGSPRAVVVATGQGLVTTQCPGQSSDIQNPRIISVVRVDGQPDDCGNPEPILPPPAPINIDIDVTYGPNNEFNITVPVVIAPFFVSVDGRINAPVTVEISPNVNISGTLELFPDFKFVPTVDVDVDIGGNQPDPAPPPSDPEGPGSPGDDDPDTPGEPEPRVYGLLCRARIESDARPSGIFQEVGPDIYAPRLGSARFGTLISGVVFWSEDIDIKGLNSVIQCPIPWGASRFAVNAAPGVAITYTPISTAPKEWPPFLQLGGESLSDNR